MAICCFGAALAQQVAVKTNALYWATGTINAGAEIALGEHSTIGTTFNVNPWTYGADNKIQHWFIRPEYRYWVTETYTRLFFGFHVMGGGFEIGGFRVPVVGDRIFEGFKAHYYKGDFYAAGFSVGYQFYISPRFNLELSAGGGIARVKYHTEHLNGSSRSRTIKRTLPVPTEIGVSFVYLFNAKK